jgi:hypothetical protein
MRITEGQLRRIIRETLLQEVPIVFGPDDSATDYRTPSSGDTGQVRRPKRPSIGRHTLRRAENRAKAKVLFQKTEDNWAIVTLDDINQAETALDTVKFKQWIGQQGFPKGTRILVVAGTPMEDDFTSTQWTVAHDIIGHTLEIWIRSKFIREISSGAFSATGLITDAAKKLLSAEKMPGNRGDEDPDVFAALFFGELDPVQLRMKAEELGRGRHPSLAGVVSEVGPIIDIYEAGITAWIKSIPPDVPTLIRPF